LPGKLTLALLAFAVVSGCSARPDAGIGPVGASVPLSTSEPRQPIAPMSKEKAPPPVFDVSGPADESR
jgi:hypothetical protein